MKRRSHTLVMLALLVTAQVIVGVAQAGGHRGWHGQGYSGGHKSWYRAHGGKHYAPRHGRYKHHRYGYYAQPYHGYKYLGGGRRYGHYGGHKGGHRYDYLLGGLLIGAAATYLLTQPRHAEPRNVVYPSAPAVAVNPTLGSVLEYNPTGQATAWQDPDTGTTFTTAPVRTHMTSSGPCREYHMSVTIGGQVQQAYGTACRQNDGSWQLQR